MNPETVCRRVVDYTKQEMHLHGTAGLTMDNIARGMKMSKRTLYQLFPGKACLFHICLADFAHAARRHLQQQQNITEHSCLQQLFVTVDAYLSFLQSVGRTLLSDIATDTDYHTMWERETAFWLQQFTDALARCKVCGYLLPDIHPENFATDLQETIYQSCLQGLPYIVQCTFTHALLRGIFKVDGIRYIDENGHNPIALNINKA